LHRRASRILADRHSLDFGGAISLPTPLEASSIEYPFMSKVKKPLLILMKLALVCAIFVWLHQKGHIDIAVFQTLTWGPHLLYLAISILSIFTCMILQTFRAKWLLDAQNYRVPIKAFFKISWISYFFCAFLPGGVTSDVVKFSYLHGTLKRSRSVIALVLLIDRISGLVSLAVLTFVSSMLILNFAHQDNPELWKLLVFSSSILIGTFLLMGIAMHPHTQDFPLLKPLHRFEVFHSLAEAFKKFRNKRLVLWKALWISTMCQGLTLFSIYTLQFVLYPEPVFSLLSAFALFPFALFAAVIPVAPQGFGVSQMALVTVASFLHISGASTAVTLYTTFQILVIFCFLTGAIPYIGYKQGKV
jgi:uncharacterized membrane protein YbhN (UPF0104 family)